MPADAIIKATAFLKNAFCTKPISPARRTKTAMNAKQNAEKTIQTIPFDVSDNSFMVNRV